MNADAAGQAHVNYQREHTLKDHLGNLRLAYRAGQVRTLTAGLKPGNANRETQQFDSLSVNALIATYVGGQARTPNYVARLNAGGSAPQPLRPLTQLAVQKGDSIKAEAPGYYPQAVSNSSFAFSLLSYVTALLQPSQSNQTVPADGSTQTAFMFYSRFRPAKALASPGRISSTLL